MINKEQHYVGNKELYILTQEEMDNFIISMDTINLSLIDIEGFKKYLNKFDKYCEKDLILEFQTGTFGLLLFSKLFYQMFSEISTKVRYIKTDLNTNYKSSFIEYDFPHITIRVGINIELDSSNTIIDFKSGYPIEAETLKLVNIKRNEKDT